MSYWLAVAFVLIAGVYFGVGWLRDLGIGLFLLPFILLALFVGLVLVFMAWHRWRMRKRRTAHVFHLKEA